MARTESEAPAHLKVILHATNLNDRYYLVASFAKRMYFAWLSSIFSLRSLWFHELITPVCQLCSATYHTFG